MHEQKMCIHGKSENSLGNGEGTVSWIAVLQPNKSMFSSQAGTLPF